jgi:DNA-binding response OmpR family regulator
MTPHLLLVEDDDAIAETLTAHLEAAGFRVQRERDGGAAMHLPLDFDLVLLDGMLPGADGWDICRHFRQQRPQLPILMLSARTSEAHRVLGLELGADDYIAKPFSMLELVARVRAHLRRVAQWRSTPAEDAPLRHGPFELLPRDRVLRRDGQNLALTLREFELLHFLVRHPGQAFGREELLNRVWGAGFDGYEHTVNSHINRLRAKLEPDPRQPRWLQTVWGVGYRWVAA